MKLLFKTISLFFCLSLLLLGLNTCVGGFGFAFKEHLFDNYYLTAPDVIEQCSLSYHSESDGSIYGTVIVQTVFAVGYNDKYLIAKRYYCNNPDGSLDKSKIKYCILPLIEGMDWRTKNGLLETMDSLTFESIRKNLGISDLKFTKNIDF